MPQITEKQFIDLLSQKLDHVDLKRAVALFRNYGPATGAEVLNVLLHATERRKVISVITALEIHWDRHLQFQHPYVRGTIRGPHGENATENMFLDVRSAILRLD